MWIRNSKIVFGISLLVWLGSCARRPQQEDLVKLDKKKDKELIETVENLSLKRPNTLYSKIKCHFSDTTKSVGFKTSLRMVKDSAINTLITYASIPVVNALITPDSLNIANKKDKCAIRTTMRYIEESFGVDFEFKNMEEILLGIPVAYDSTEKYFVINDPYNYIVSSHRKHKARRELRNNRIEHQGPAHRRVERETPFIIQYFLNSDLRSLKRVIINSPDDTTQITLDYYSRDSIADFLIPKNTVVTIVTPRNKIVLTLDYDKTEVNVPQEIRFIIPEEYGICNEGD